MVARKLKLSDRTLKSLNGRLNRSVEAGLVMEPPSIQVERPLNCWV